jgi:hypothetical protein
MRSTSGCCGPGQLQPKGNTPTMSWDFSSAIE